MFKKKVQPKVLIKTLSTKRDFSYSKGGCNLNFTLNIDNSTELNDFADCLEAALYDVTSTKEEKN